MYNPKESIKDNNKSCGTITKVWNQIILDKKGLLLHAYGKAKGAFLFCP